MALASIFVLVTSMMPASVWAQAQPLMIVAPMQGQNVRNATQAIMKEVERHPRAMLVANDKVQAFLTQHAGLTQQTNSKEALEFFNKGKQAYQELEMQQAIDHLSKAKRLYQNSLYDKKTFDALRSTQFYLSQAYMALDRESEALLELKEVIRLDPDRQDKQLSPKYYSPEVRDLYKTVLTDYAAQGVGDVYVDAPDATVLHNGKTIGPSPQTLRNVPVGKHYIGAQNDQGTIILQEHFVVKGNNRVRLDTQLLSSHSTDDYFGTVAMGQPMSEIKQAFLDKMGLHVGADVFMLLAPQTGKVQAQLYDLRSQERSPIVEGENPTQLVEKAMQYLDADGYVQAKVAPSVQKPLELETKLPPQQQTASDVSSPPKNMGKMKPDQRSLIQKPWFWMAVGGVVLAAGAGVYFSGALESSPTVRNVQTEIP
jgi:tetratricopeptide (TPR) repeat protein